MYADTGKKAKTKTNPFRNGVQISRLLNLPPMEIRVGGALKTILSIYGVPKEVREQKIKKVLAMDYKTLGIDTLKKFREYVDESTEQALFDLLKRKQANG